MKRTALDTRISERNPWESQGGALVRTREAITQSGSTTGNDGESKSLPAERPASQDAGTEN